MQYKKHFEDDELKEILLWFKKHESELPKSLYIDKATYIEDFPRTVKFYFDIANEHHENPTYSGQIFHLFQMRDAVVKLWREEGKAVDDLPEEPKD